MSKGRTTRAGCGALSPAALATHDGARRPRTGWLGILLASGLAALLGIAILLLGKADSAPETGAESH